jgi:polysaccharide biosynthesis/export protein VpsN
MKFFFRACSLYLPLLVAVGLPFLAGCQTLDSGSGGTQSASSQSSTNTYATPTHMPAGASELLRVGDIVSIAFAGVVAPPVETGKHDERIKEDGTITLPYIGSVQAAGKTRGQLEKDIHDKYVPTFYKRLTVTIATEGRFFFVSGQVKNESRIQYLGETTVLKAIAAAGGFTDFAQKKKVELTRVNGQKFKVNAIKAIEKPELDLPVYPGDKIFVPRRWF